MRPASADRSRVSAATGARRLRWARIAAIAAAAGLWVGIIAVVIALVR